MFYVLDSTYKWKRTIFVFLELNLFHLAWYSPGPSMLLQMAKFHSFLWLSSNRPHILYGSCVVFLADMFQTIMKDNFWCFIFLIFLEKPLWPLFKIGLFPSPLCKERIVSWIQIPWSFYSSCFSTQSIFLKILACLF